MGAIVAILGEAGDPELPDRLRMMLTRSPYRGTPEHLIEGPLAVGIQSLGSDASLAGHGNWIVAVHGYIGNWSELAAERGWRFSNGASNAAKMAEAYEDLGDRLFAMLRGEWAVQIWDRRLQTLLAARDVTGCRPLFMHRHAGRVYLASEIRQILAGSDAETRCNPGAAADFHLVRYPAAGRTVFQGVDRLPGGILRTFHIDGGPRTWNDVDFWAPAEVHHRKGFSEDLVEELRALIDTAVTRAASDGPAGVSLSGGMDSSSLWATLAVQEGAAAKQSGKIKPYSNVYPGLPCDETPYIRSILEFTGVDGVLIDTSSVLASEYLDLFCTELDQPHLPNALPVELMCAAVAAEGRAVLMTGLGGDEWLGGSLDYIRELFFTGRVLTAARDLWSVRLPARLGGFRRKVSMLSPRPGLTGRMGIGRAPRPSVAPLVRVEHRGSGETVPGSWARRFEHEMSSPSKRRLLMNLDRLAAAAVLEIIEQQAARHGLEVRHPLMDLDIVEFGFAVEPRALVAGRCHKWLLRQAMRDRLPEGVTGRIETTEFACLFTREVDVLRQLPAGPQWHLTRLAIIDADAIDSRISETYSQSAAFEMIRLVWLEAFMRKNFASGRATSLWRGV